jgi:chemotaxis signal transduction protein
VRTLVCFSAAGTAYCLPVEATRSVRRSLGMVELVEARPDVAGVMSGDPPLTVIAPLGSGGSQILVVETADKTYGLLVDAVTGLIRVDPTDIGLPPDGQDRDLICGTICTDGHLVMVADPVAMAGRL